MTSVRGLPVRRLTTSGFRTELTADEIFGRAEGVVRDSSLLVGVLRPLGDANLGVDGFPGRAGLTAEVVAVFPRFSGVAGFVAGLRSSR